MTEHALLIRRLTPADAAAFQALRLAGLQREPSAFGSSFEEERDEALDAVAQRLAPSPDSAVFGGFDAAGALLGLVGLGRERMLKLRHKGIIWGMVVTPEARRRGLGRALMQAAIAAAREVPGLLQLNLCVNAHNTAALQLYQAQGFVPFGREPAAILVDGVLHEEVLMALRLSDVCPR